MIRGMGKMLLAIILVACGSGNGFGQNTRATSGGRREPFIAQCQVFLIDDVQVPAQETGVLTSVVFSEGDQVAAGQLLAKIDSRESELKKLAAERERAVALTRSQDDIEVRYAKASLAVAEAELNQSEEINRRSPGSVSVAEVRRLKLTRHRAALQIDRSRLEQRVTKMTASVQEVAVLSASENIARRTIVAPFSGIVVDQIRHQSEWVSAGEPVLRIIRLDRLRVEGFLSTRQINPEDIRGCPVTVEIERAGGQKVQLPGQVVFVSPLVQAGDKYRVRAEVLNQRSNDQWQLNPGMAASLTIHPVSRPVAVRGIPTPARRPAGSGGVRR